MPARAVPVLTSGQAALLQAQTIASAGARPRWGQGSAPFPLPGEGVKGCAVVQNLPGWVAGVGAFSDREPVASRPHVLLSACRDRYADVGVENMANPRNRSTALAAREVRRSLVTGAVESRPAGGHNTARRIGQSCSLRSQPGLARTNPYVARDATHDLEPSFGWRGRPYRTVDGRVMRRIACWPPPKRVYRRMPRSITMQSPMAQRPCGVHR